MVFDGQEGKEAQRLGVEGDNYGFKVLHIFSHSLGGNDPNIDSACETKHS